MLWGQLHIGRKHIQRCSWLQPHPRRPCHTLDRRTADLAASMSAERLPGSPTGRFGISSLRLVPFAFSVSGERAVAYFSFTKLVRSFTVARAGLHFVFLRFSLTAKRQSPLLPSSSLRPHFLLFVKIKSLGSLLKPQTLQNHGKEN